MTYSNYNQRLRSSRWQRQRAYEAIQAEIALDTATDLLAALDATDGGQRANEFTQVRLDCMDAEAQVWMTDG